MKFHKLHKKGVDLASPETLVIILLCIILGLFFLYFIWDKVGERLIP